MTISDYRYWVIDGIFPEGFNATADFFFSKSSYLDNGIVVNPEDSVTLLYRPTTNDEWQFINYTYIGPWNLGKFYVENVQPGLYTIAVVDEMYVGNYTSIAKPKMKIYPNPSGETFRINTNQAGTLLFYDINGKVLENITIKENQDSVEWKPTNLPYGTYFVRYNSKKNEILAVEKLIYLQN